jgi:5-methylcytosine-specific restriction endonuclease McrA
LAYRNEYTARYREANAERYKAYMTEYLSEWKRENTDKIREYTFRRRAKKAQTATGPIDYSTLWESSGGSCAICNKLLDRSAPWPSPKFASVDHIIPLSKGGAHIQSNLQYACLDCNLRKHAKVS